MLIAKEPYNPRIESRTRDNPTVSRLVIWKHFGKDITSFPAFFAIRIYHCSGYIRGPNIVCFWVSRRSLWREYWPQFSRCYPYDSKQIKSTTFQDRRCRAQWQDSSLFAPSRSFHAPTSINTKSTSQDVPPTSRRLLPFRPSALPTLPDVSNICAASTSNMDYVVLVSMYEVYNDRIYDLLSHPRNAKDSRRRPLLFKSTEGSPDRKVVAGLKKVVCGSYEEALMVLEIGLTERSVAGTGSNSVSSRSHGFFCLEVKKRRQGGMSTAWTGSQLTIVDLAGR